MKYVIRTVFFKEPKNYEQGSENIKNLKVTTFTFYNILKTQKKKQLNNHTLDIFKSIYVNLPM